jgi:hypothetical protein
MPTVLDVLRTQLLGDEAAARLEQALAMMIPGVVPNPILLDRDRPNFAGPDSAQINQSSTSFEGSQKGIPVISDAIVKAMQSASPGYEPLFIASGWDPFMARAVAKLAVRRGRRCAKESKMRRPVYEAIRFLAQRVRQTRAILSRAKLILKASADTTIIETVFAEADISETEFLILLRSVIEGKETNRQRIREIAVDLLPNLSLDRGPKVSAPSAAHEFLVEEGTEIHLNRGSNSRRDRSAEYIDPLTRATRLEFDAPNFDSRPARRRLKARKGANSAK